MNEASALASVHKSFNGTRKCSLIKETSDSFAFLCEATTEGVIPSKIVVAVDKKSGKLGASIISVLDAINNSK